MTTPRAHRRQKRLRSIKDAALELVVDDGVDGFSVHKLADRVDLTAGALYRYFSSKDEILIAVQTDVLAEFDRFLESLQSRQSKEPVLHRIAGICRGYAALADLQPQRFALIAQLVAVPQQVFDDAAVAPVAERTMSMLGRLAEIVRDAQDTGVLGEGNAERRAVVAWASIHGVVERRKLARFAPTVFDVEGLLDELLFTLLVGWGAETRAARAAVDDKPNPRTLKAALRAAQTSEA